MEMKVDNEYFAGFHEQYITKGSFFYMEKYVKHVVEMVKILREMSREYQLFIIEQGSERNSILSSQSCFFWLVINIQLHILEGSF